jgi:hypothetical protein
MITGHTLGLQLINHKGWQTGTGQQNGLRQVCMGKDKRKGNVSHLVFKPLF